MRGSKRQFLRADGFGALVVALLPGIARVTAPSSTKTGAVVGTPLYTSPTRLAGRSRDGHSDLFSLGVMLYRMLTATRPVVGGSMAPAMFHMATNRIPDISTARREPNPDMRAIVKAPHKDLAQGMPAAPRSARPSRNQQARIK